MSKFQDFNKQRWNKLPFKDQQILISVALNTAASVWQGQGKDVQFILDYADEILEHYWQLEQYKGFDTGSQAAKPLDMQGDKDNPF